MDTILGRTHSSEQPDRTLTFDPQDAEFERVARDFAKLAKRWTAKPRTSKTPPG